MKALRLLSVKEGSVMSVEEQWTLIRRGDVEGGLAHMHKAFVDTPNPSTLVTLGLGYLWTERYEDACFLLEDWMRTYGTIMEIYLAFVGVARWCLDDPTAATESWMRGLDAQQVDMAGGMESPLLLWVSSVLREERTIQRKALQVLAEKVKDPKVRHWPGPLAQFVLGQIDEERLDECSVERTGQRITPRRAWQVEFYKLALGMQQAHLTPLEFDTMMKAKLLNSVLELSGIEDFLQLVRNPEYYLARHEASIA
jgi:hypothetical protein